MLFGVQDGLGPGGVKEVRAGKDGGTWQRGRKSGPKRQYLRWL